MAAPQSVFIGGKEAARLARILMKAAALLPDEGDALLCQRMAGYLSHAAVIQVGSDLPPGPPRP